MSRFTDAVLADAPDHGVLASPWTFEIVGVSYVRHLEENERTPTLDLHLERGTEIRLLRFVGVTELEIEAGFPYSYMGLKILDVAYLGWQDIRVRVMGFEPAPGIRFWAASVTETSRSR